MGWRQWRSHPSRNAHGKRCRAPAARNHRRHGPASTIRLEMSRPASPARYTKEDFERALDRLALEIEAYGPRGNGLIQMYQAIEDELERLRSEEAVMSSVSA